MESISRVYISGAPQVILIPERNEYGWCWCIALALSYAAVKNAHNLTE